MKKLYLVFALLVLISGCATVFNSNLQNINISSSADSLTGSIDGIPFKGPGIVSVKRGRASKIITIDTPSCNKQTILASSVDPLFFLNIISLYYGLFGSTTDFASEKMWNYQEQIVIPCK